MKKDEIVKYILETTSEYNGSFESWIEDYCGMKTRKDKTEFFKSQFNCHGNTIIAVCKELNIRY